MRARGAARPRCDEVARLATCAHTAHWRLSAIYIVTTHVIQSFHTGFNSVETSTVDDGRRIGHRPGVKKYNGVRVSGVHMIDLDFTELVEEEEPPAKRAKACSSDSDSD